MPRAQTFHLSIPDKNNIVSLNNYITDDYNRLDFPPGSFVKIGAADSTDRTIAEIIFAETDADHAVATRARPTYWRNGYFILRYWWSDDVADNNVAIESFVIGHQIGSAKSGTTLTNPTTVETATGANELQRTELEETTNLITADYDLLTVSISRNGPAANDTSTGDVTFHGAQLVYVDKRR